MKYDPSARVLQFTSDEEVERFHTELSALLRNEVIESSGHGDAEQGKAAAQAVFKDFATILRALNAFRKHLKPTADG